MLPGLRFLFVAVVLSVSMLVFGLGAAALLRATHEEFASLPLKQIPEVVFATRPDAEPTLAVLQIDAPAAGPAPDASQAVPADAPAMIAVPATPELAPASDPGIPASDQVAALPVTPAESDKLDFAKPDFAKPDSDITPPAAGENVSARPAPVAQDTIATSPAATSVAPEPAAAAVIAEPSADAAINSPDPERTVAALDPGTAGSAAPASTERKSIEPAVAGIGSGDSRADKTPPDDAKIIDSKTPPSSAVATAETGSKEGTGNTPGVAAAPGLTAAEAKPVTSGMVPQGFPTDAASISAPAEATAKIAALGIPMPVERPKTLGKASLAIKPKPAARKRIVRRPTVRHTRTARPAQQEQPANPFAASPFGLN